MPLWIVALPILAAGCASLATAERPPEDALRRQAAQARALKEQLTAADLEQRRTISAVELARLMIAQRRFDLAERYLDDAARETPRNAQVAALRGTLFRERGEPALARHAYEEALRLDATLAEAHDGLGQILTRERRYADAAAHFRKAVETAPHDARFQNNLGFAYFLDGQIDPAIAAYEAATAAAPDAAQYHNNLGYAYGRAGRFPEAFRAFRRAGTEAEAFNNLGFVYQARADYREAAKLYDRALDRDPTLGRAYQNLILVCAKLDRGDSACTRSRAEGGAEVESK
jgi:Flp pilus assembly protein TadD